MGLLIILRRTSHPWPVLMAQLREEAPDRASDPAARHWPDRDVLAPRDRATEGTWTGLNDHGVIAGLVSRDGAIGPLPNKRSRGELPLEALDHADAETGMKALLDLDARAYRPFNMIVADNRDAYWLRNDGRKTKSYTLPEGLTLIAGREANDPGDARLSAALASLRSLPPPDPAQDDWSAWDEILTGLQASVPPPLTARALTRIALPAIGSTEEARFSHQEF